jgi:hypothetical protein
MFAALALALVMSAPAAEAGMARKIEDDVSNEILESGLARVWYEAFVAPDGTIEDCSVRGAIGDEDAAEAVCLQVVGRRAKPAIGPDGQPTYGFLRDSINFADNYRYIPSDAVRPDLALTVAGALEKPERVTILVAVDAAGQVSDCVGGDQAPGFVKAACEQAKSLSLPARTAQSGEAVSYLFPMVVEFRADNS